MYYYHVKACQVSDSMSIVKCYIIGVRYQVLSEDMSSTGVRYHVSSIRCQVSGVKYRCQISLVKYNMSSVGVKCSISVPVSGIM